MNKYIIDRLRADANHLLLLAENEDKLQHQGMKGRFRELLIDNILSPWLPPDVKCGTGMIIGGENFRRDSTQDDVILYDKSLCPPVLVSDGAPEGIFLYNSVLARIEVKSTLNRSELNKFVRASIDISKFKVDVRPGCDALFTGALNMLFAYKSDQKIEEDKELKRLVEVMKEENLDSLSGIVSMICVPGWGFYKIGMGGQNKVWQKHNSNDALDHIAWFVGCVSNSCFQYRIQRQGRKIENSLEGGIGLYLNHPFDTIKI